MAFNVVTSEKEDETLVPSSNQRFVEHLPDDWSNDEEVAVIDEDIIKNYLLLYEKWLLSLKTKQVEAECC